jgi:hypothetical protein
MHFAVAGGWQLWFVRLSGWPVFLAVVATAVLFSVALSIALTQLGNVSAVRSALIAMIALTLLAVVIIAGLVLASRL